MIAQIQTLRSSHFFAFIYHRVINPQTSTCCFPFKRRVFTQTVLCVWNLFCLLHLGKASEALEVSLMSTFPILQRKRSLVPSLCPHNTMFTPLCHCVSSQLLHYSASLAARTHTHLPSAQTSDQCPAERKGFIHACSRAVSLG